MTEDKNRNEELEVVLDEFASLPELPDAETLRVWKKNYPQFARELSDFAADRIAMAAASHGRTVDDAQISSVINRTMSRVQGMIDAAGRAEPLTDLGSDIFASGNDYESFQQQVRIDRTILDSLIRRLPKRETLPALLLRLAAAALNRKIESVRDYFCLPGLPAAAHSARRQPTVVQVDFAVLVNDSALSDDEKRFWLSEPPDPELRARADG